MTGDAGSGGPAGLKGLLARRGALPVIGGLVAVLVIGVVVVLAAGGGGGGGSSAVAQPTKGPADSAGLAKTPEATGTPAPTPDLAQATTVVSKPANGAIPGSDSADRIIIGKANTNAPITLSVVPASGGELASPKGADDVVFYDFTNWPGIGGYPGVGGNAIFSGHVDWGGRDGTGCKNNTVRPPCQAVFWDLDKVVVGDTIQVVLRGVTYTYRVTGALDMAADDVDTWNKVIKSTAKESITLITCTGTFDTSSREYNKRHIVTGERV
jgi:hypothetical protein